MPAPPTARRSRIQRRRRSTRSRSRSAATATTRTATATPTRRASTRTATTTSTATTATTTIPSATTRPTSIPSPIRRTAAATASASSARPTSTPNFTRRPDSVPDAALRRRHRRELPRRRQRSEERHHLRRRRRLRRLSGAGNGQATTATTTIPAVHPGALEPCGSTKDLNCNGTIDDGCVPCDLDGDGFERDGRGQRLPRRQRQAPGHGRLQRRRRRRVPRRDRRSRGGTEGGVSVGKVAGGAARLLPRASTSRPALTGTAKIASFGGMVGDADCNGKAVRGLPGASIRLRRRRRRLAGRGHVERQDCNPGNVTLDCDDNDPTIFPARAGQLQVDRPTYKENCTPQRHADCTGDTDGDGYAAPADCDDNDPTVHPFARRALRRQGQRLRRARRRRQPRSDGRAAGDRRARSPTCTDSNTGECAKTKGTCVCSVAQPVSDPMRRSASRASPARARPARGQGAALLRRRPAAAAELRRRPRPRTTTATAASTRPTARNLAVKGMTCGINVGQCKAGIVDRLRHDARPTASSRSGARRRRPPGTSARRRRPIR